MTWKVSPLTLDARPRLSSPKPLSLVTVIWWGPAGTVVGTVTLMARSVQDATVSGTWVVLFRLGCWFAGLGGADTVTVLFAVALGFGRLPAWYSGPSWLAT